MDKNNIYIYLFIGVVLYILYTRILYKKLYNFTTLPLFQPSDSNIKVQEITNYLTHCIENKIPVSFSKYGDGEYFAVTSKDGANCDNDKYTQKLKDNLIESFKYIIKNNNNTYIGFWNNMEYANFWQNLVGNHHINWANYHTIIMDGHNQLDKVNLYKKIRFSNLKKIIVCNPLLIKSKILFNIDYVIHISINNWFDTQYENILSQIRDIMNNTDEQFIVITACGMGAKVLISNLVKSNPNNIYLDFGSAIDKLCTKRNTRGGGVSYDQLLIDLKDIIPDNWNDSKYDYIYEESRDKLGTHISKELFNISKSIECNIKYYSDKIIKYI